ncbi:MAG: type I-E CRISPR-associated endoribonuclease Cas2 [Blastocatellales bacterium]|nr:type I-E CRISPR-associated endoribonuclease Cas2 [Blastocatellales bacterium]
MVVIVLERVSPSVHGELTRWLLEPRTGVFVGNISASVRDLLWKMVCGKMRSGAGMMIHNAQNEQGFAIRYHGDTSRTVEDFDGLLLIRVPFKSKDQES